MNRDVHEDRCKQCCSVYRCIAYTMGSGDIMVVKECNCVSPSTSDVTRESQAKRDQP